MRSEGNILWMEVQDLMAFGISEATIKSGMYSARSGSQSWHHIPDPADARRKLIDYDSIPAITIARYNIPTKELLLTDLAKTHQATRTEALKRLAGESANLSDYDHYIKAGLRPNRAAGLATSAAYLRALESVRGKADVRALDIPGIDTKTDLTEALLDMIKTERPEGLHRVSNLQVFRRAITRWNKALTTPEKLNTLVHGHKAIRGISEGCQNARKMTDTEEKILLSKWLNTETDVKLSPVQIHAWYSTLAQGDADLADTDTGEVYTGLTELSLSTVKRLFSRPEVTALGRYRHGSKYYRDVVRPYVFGRRPEYSFSFSSSDGFTMPFWVSVKGKSTWKRAVAYVIFDVHSTAIIGGAIGLAENKELMRAAFKDMVIRQGGRLPIDNQLDNFNKFYKQELEQIMGVRFCEPYNSQSKYAETNIKSFKTQVLSRYQGFIGRHSLRNETNKRNPDKENPDSGDVGYTMEETEVLFRQAIDEYNGLHSDTHGMVRSEALAAHVNPATSRLSNQMAATIYGERISATIDRGLIRLTRAGETYTYEVPDYEMTISELRNGMKVRVRYLDHLLGKAIWIYNYAPGDDPGDDILLCECSLARGTQRAPAEQTQADRDALSDHIARVRRFDRMVDELAGTIPADLAVLTPDEADAALAAGYTSKAQIKKASELIDRPATETEKPASKGLNPRWQ